MEILTIRRLDHAIDVDRGIRKNDPSGFVFRRHAGLQESVHVAVEGLDAVADKPASHTHASWLSAPVRPEKALRLGALCGNGP